MLFLHGGGDSPLSRTETLGRFMDAATSGSTCTLALVVAEESEPQARASFEAYRAIFTALPNAPAVIEPVLVAPARPLRRAHLEQLAPSGVFVCGGSTPLYHEALCLDTEWLVYLRAAGIPYGGTSAGAAIAARRAILGGWQATRGGQARAVLFQGASEGLDAITVREGLGLVPFAIDVHASQLGTLTRMIHAVQLGLVPEGWAIDEDTLLEIGESDIRIHGQGHAYHVWRDEQQAVHLMIQTAEPLAG
jgi:cyanophycinase